MRNSIFRNTNAILRFHAQETTNGEKKEFRLCLFPRFFKIAGLEAISRHDAFIAIGRDPAGSLK